MKAHGKIIDSGPTECVFCHEVFEYDVLVTHVVNVHEKQEIIVPEAPKSASVLCKICLEDIGTDER